MPDYVYALHDFQPEHEDEVPFRAGERIEVVEKDDLYGDGWWQGRNLLGRVGLFPVSYTAPAPPSAEALQQSASTSSTASDSTVSASTDQPPPKTALQSLDEESEPELQSRSQSPKKQELDIIAPIPKAPAVFLNGSKTLTDDEEEDDGYAADGDGVMKATISDVQKAIEQLGRRGQDGDGSRSFSFASTKEGETDETDFDISDIDANGDDDAEGEGWHNGARQKLAERARKAVEDAEKLEALSNDSASRRRPPIEVEISDESDEEEDEGYTRRSAFSREPFIPEEDEEESDGAGKALNGTGHGKEESSATAAAESTVAGGSTATATAAASEEDLIIPEKDEAEVQTATATRSSFPAIQSPPLPYADTSRVQSPEIVGDIPRTVGDIPRAAATPFSAPSVQSNDARLSLPTPTSPTMNGSSVASAPIQLPEQVDKRSSAPASQTSISLLSSTTSSTTQETTPQVFSPPPQVAIEQPPLTASSQQATLVDSLSEVSSKKPGDKEKEKTHPSEWTVDEVVDWLKSKGFDQDVCDKFTEQEITGDVLLELDVNLLKTEIGIMAFGKRMRIANAITDLRRPPSIVYSDHPETSSPFAGTPVSQTQVFPQSQLFPQSQYTSSQFGYPQAQGYTPQSQTHSRTQSQSQSHHSFPGSTMHNYSQSMQSSLGSPLGYGPGFAGGMQQSPAVQEPSVSEGETIGVAIGDAEDMKAMKRPVQLNQSPSDGALKASAKAISDIPERAEDEDRGHMSEGEALPPKSVRRRIWGRSQDSGASAPSHHSKESYSPANGSPIVKDIPDKDKDADKDVKPKDKDSASVTSRHTRGKRSIDAGKSGDRLSIFGATFSGTLGKGRKPAPRVSEDGTLSEKASMFTLPRLHGSSIRKASSSSQRPGTSGGVESSPKAKEFKEKGVFSPKESKEEKKEEKEKERVKEKEQRDPALLRKRTSSAVANGPSSDAAKVANGVVSGTVKQGQSILDQIGEPDFSGWMRKKGDRYNSWKMRYFVLKGPHMYCLRSNSKTETRLKGYIDIVGYKVTVDENVDPGRYGFRIDHDQEKTHYFSSDEKSVVREWMKAIMKATIGRDYTKPVVSSCNIPTIPLVVAQTMNPAPRPPSPSARDATQKALRRENPNQLSSRDARVLMGIPGDDEKKQQAALDSLFTENGNGDTASGITTPKPPKAAVPPRPSRELRRLSVQRSPSTVEEDLIEWANSHLPGALKITDPNGPLCGGLALLRLAESIKGRPTSPPVPDSAFPVDENDDKLDGLFKLFDFLLDNDVKMGSVSINDVRLGKRDKIIQLLRALKSWEDKRRAIANSIGKGAVQAGSFMAPVAFRI
ncbi:hypothetical protein BDQ12DRAFT_719130 [Crucibulum laeve]|uniref:PH domain-containing protein n=1 Tax=Crucibulum laeve TaxID=68775 RepID=A0A5C3MGD1_9AGAR|nr:hypothetical protein BDQ12DRAFT_719130 [Crucibulum laeve]